MMRGRRATRRVTVVWSDTCSGMDIQMQRIGRVTSAAGVLALGLVVAGPVAAQMQPWGETGYVNVNYGYQTGDRAFQESLTATVYAEEAVLWSSVPSLPFGAAQLSQR